jgi:O-acetyl-ADP-ribose deacetylase (regulator of RNase III)
MQHLQGDLFYRFEPAVMSDIAFDAIAHVCNCQAVMGSGIAKSIKERYPAAYKAYMHQGKVVLGDITCGWVANRKMVCNLHAQEFYGTDGRRYLDYEALYKCLEKMKKELTRVKLNTLGVPYNMGCDRAGGDWRVVEAMLDSVFDEASGIKVFSVKL